MLAPPELLQQACAGDAAALGRVLQVCQPDLRRFARRTCHSSEDAEDAVQLALWQVHRRLGGLRAVEAFASWVFRIVERECWRLFRGHGAFARGPDADAQVAQAPAPMPQQDLQLDLIAALQALPPPYRQVLILRDVDELTAPEVAEQLGISVAAVKSRLHRARAQVREHLQARGYDEEAGG